MKLLITDLDNTLYDWVTYFANSFGVMAKCLAETLDIPIDQVLDEFKTVHQWYHNSEQPFALFEIASVRERYGHLQRADLKRQLDSAMYKFNKKRREHLCLYPNVEDTLLRLHRRGVRIVGHTEAIAVNAYFRLRFLKIDKLFTRLYAIGGHVKPHPEPERELALAPPPDFLRILPVSERKPNPALLVDICAQEGFAIDDAVYVGDSLTRDMSMAKFAGVKAVWAAYGLEYEKSLWDFLVRVTHWSTEDIEREARLRTEFKDVLPDATIRDFGELLSLEWESTTSLTSMIEPAAPVIQAR